MCACVYYASNPTPIVIDTDGTGFNLTSVQDGVMFDFYGTGMPIRISWTAENSTNGWLALDRDENGTIDNAKELFGNVSAQPPSNDPNGFMALAEFDDPKNGGNGDGVISSKDAVWPRLRIWIDKNHNGVSEPEELHSLSEFGIEAISLNYHETRVRDKNGNVFRYRGSMRTDKTATTDKVIYDVLLTTETPDLRSVDRPLGL
jgi:hypothetical protein